METDNKFETFLCKQCEISKSEIAQASTYTKHKQLNTWRNKIRKIKNSEGKEIRIDIPEFQRGLVWKASQIETLWDSVMRGIPIGCITLIKYKGEAKENQAEYGVFDGQQRLYALSLCHETPFAENTEDDNPPILWLDFWAEEKVKKTRKYCFYLTTPGQPWGYKIGDNGIETNQIKLNTEECRKAIDEASINSSNFKQVSGSKPRTIDMCPYQANCPIPFSIIWKASNNCNIKFIERVLDEIEKKDINGKSIYEQFAWYKKDSLQKFLQDSRNMLNTADSEEYKTLRDKWNELKEGIDNARNADIVIIVSPQKFNRLKKTSIESKEENDVESDSNSDVAVFFSRLNRGGKEPTMEEIRYSILKSIVPDLSIIDDIAKDKMPPAELANIAMRVYLSVSSKNAKWRVGITLKDVYFLARSEGFHDFITSSNKVELENGIVIDSLQFRINCLYSILLYGGKHADFGLPPYIVSSVINENNNLFALFLCKYYNYESIECLSTFALMSIYGQNVDFDKAFNAENINEMLYSLSVNGQLLIPPPPEIYAKIQDATANQDKQLLDRAREDSMYIDSIKRTWYWKNYQSRLLLLYSCRKYMKIQFNEYDPASSVWNEDNCPWDYDHIFPQKWITCTQGKSHGKYHDLVDLFINCIGNIAPIPYSKNRSKQDQAPFGSDEKYLGERNADIFLDFESVFGEQLPNFISNKPSIDIENFKDDSYKLALAIASRLQNIYSRCYEQLSWKTLLDFLSNDNKRIQFFKAFSDAIIPKLNELSISIDNFSIWTEVNGGLQHLVDFDKENKLFANHCDYGRKVLAYGLEVDYIISQQVIKKALLCVCYNKAFERVEWGLRRHPSDKDVNGYSHVWWLPNETGIPGWGNGLIYKSKIYRDESTTDGDFLGNLISDLVELIKNEHIVLLCEDESRPKALS